MEYFLIITRESESPILLREEWIPPEAEDGVARSIIFSPSIIRNFLDFPKKSFFPYFFLNARSMMT